MALTPDYQYLNHHAHVASKCRLALACPPLQFTLRLTRRCWAVNTRSQSLKSDSQPETATH
eukprot:8429818-Alexandrium_andersonii.AAC.1